MADSISCFDNPPIISSASSSEAAVDDNFEEACSICLEPFNTDDPSTVTNCKHEYHLQCILEWSQRSKECPICWQLLGLKDPASQELLAAVEIEKNLRTRRSAHNIHEVYEIDDDAFYTDDSDFDEHIMRRFAASASRTRYVNKRGRQRSSGIGPSQVLFPVPSADLPDVQQMYTTSPEECQISGYGLVEGDSPASSTSTTINYQRQRPSSVVPPSIVNVVSNNVGDRDGSVKPRVLCSQLPPDSPRKPSSSEFLAFSESIKSRFSAASTRCKESISKSTRGFKEKILARNVSVKEMGRGVQREMSAGIAGVARMIERLDLNSKLSGASVPLSSSGGTSNFSYKGKGVQESVITHSLNGNTGETAHDMSSAAPPYAYNTIPGPLEVSIMQRGN
uniref:RING-type E3 ubiquitin transferase n=1 Tax=Davidia involucrata TaxID=16924 RepID=A0A5B7A4M0_DAVIN